MLRDRYNPATVLLMAEHDEGPGVPNPFGDDEARARIWAIIVGEEGSDEVARQRLLEAKGARPEQLPPRLLDGYKVEVLNRPKPGDYRFEYIGRDDWLRVHGGPLQVPIEVKFGMAGGRPKVFGLRVDPGHEVTADALRTIKVGEIVRTFFAQPPTPRGVSPADRQQLIFDWAQERQELLNKAPTSPPATRGTPPDDERLKAFADTYRALGGAMSAVAKHQHMARSTAYRWLDLCRSKGFITLADEEGNL